MTITSIFGRKDQLAARRNRRRGATAIETAIILSFVTIPLVAVVDNIQEQQGSNIADSGDRVGYPSESNSVNNTNSGTGNVTDGSGSTNSGTTSTAFPDLSATVTQQGANWTTTIVMQVTDAAGGTGNIIADGVIEGTWTRDTGTFETASCTIDSNGYCVITLKEKKTEVQSATFRIDSLTSGTAVLDTSTTYEIAVADSAP